jgi:hypothetical protein
MGVEYKALRLKNQILEHSMPFEGGRSGLLAGRRALGAFAPPRCPQKAYYVPEFDFSSAAFSLFPLTMLFTLLYWRYIGFGLREIPPLWRDFAFWE